MKPLTSFQIRRSSLYVFDLTSSASSSSSPNPQIKECLVSFIHLDRANAVGISNKILNTLTHPSLSLNIHKICGQAYDGAAVMSSDKAGVQAKIKEVSPMALYTHCYSHSPLLHHIKFKRSKSD